MGNSPTSAAHMALLVVHKNAHTTHEQMSMAVHQKLKGDDYIILHYNIFFASHLKMKVKILNSLSSWTIQKQAVDQLWLVTCGFLSLCSLQASITTYFTGYSTVRCVHIENPEEKAYTHLYSKSEPVNFQNNVFVQTLFINLFHEFVSIQGAD
jgi:hypothetical protein